jgi:outer membrane protein
MTTMHRAARGRIRLCVCLSALLATGAWAQGDLKIGIINAERVLLEAPQTERVLRRLQDEFAPRERTLLATQSDLQAKEEKYRRDQEVMGADERATLERELREGLRAFQRDQDEYNEDLNVRRNELLAEARRAVAVQIEAYARMQGYDLILQNAVFFSSAIDITDSLVAYIKETTPTAAAPAPSAN